MALEESKEIKSYKFFKSESMTKELYKWWKTEHLNSQSKWVWSVDHCDIAAGEIHRDWDFDTLEEALVKYNSIKEVK